LLLSMLISLMVASLVLAEASLRGVVPRRQPPSRLHAGAPFLMGIALRNDKQRLPSFSIEVEDLCDDKVVDKRCYFLKIPSGRTQQTAYRHSLPHRGRYVFFGVSDLDQVSVRAVSLVALHRTSLGRSWSIRRWCRWPTGPRR
jgi:hypothetical protein